MELKSPQKTAIALGLGALVVPALAMPIWRAIQENFDKEGPQISGASLVNNPEIHISSLPNRTLITPDGTYTLSSRPSVLTSFVSTYTVSPDGTYVLFSQLYPKEDSRNSKDIKPRLGLKFTTWNTQSGKILESKFPSGLEPTITPKREDELALESERSVVVDFAILGTAESAKFALVSTFTSGERDSVPARQEGSTFPILKPVTLWGISLQNAQVFKLGEATQGDFIFTSPKGDDGYIFSVKRDVREREGEFEPVTLVSYFSMKQGVSANPTTLRGLVIPRGWAQNGSLVNYYQEPNGPEGWWSINPGTGESKKNEGPVPEYVAPKRFSSPLIVEKKQGRCVVRFQDDESALILPQDIKGGTYFPSKLGKAGSLMLIKDDGTAVVYSVTKK